MSKIKTTVDKLKELQETLEPLQDQDPVAPEVGSIFLTFNDSVVYIFSAEENPHYDPDFDSDEDEYGERWFDAVILVGGHGIPTIGGEKPGEQYRLGASGQILTYSDFGPELVLSLREKLPFDLSEYL